MRREIERGSGSGKLVCQGGSRCASESGNAAGRNVGEIAAGKLTLSISTARFGEKVAGLSKWLPQECRSACKVGSAKTGSPA